jgi:MFS transporter, FSR family, fosmidomycin resistance protein
VVSEEADLAARANQDELKWRGVAVFSSTHLVHDSYLGVLGIVLPALRDKLQFSLALAGLLGPAQQVGSLFQPLFGAFGDRFGHKRLVVMALLGTGISMSLVGFSWSFAVLAALVFLSGLSSSIFHPSGSVLLTDQGGKRWGLALSVYSFGGNIGLALGPLVATGLLIWQGLTGLALLSIPAVFFGWLLGRFVRAIPEKARTSKPNESIFRWWLQERAPLTYLAIVIGGRAFAAGGLSLFLPTLLVERGFSMAVVGAITALYFAAGGLGGLASGWLSDKFGRLTVMAVMMTLAPIAWLTFIFIDGPFALVALFIAAAAILGEQPVLTALGQEMYPERRGSIVGYTLGAGFALQSVGTLLVGTLGTFIGLSTAFAWLAICPFLAVPALYGLHKWQKATAAATRSQSSG